MSSACTCHINKDECLWCKKGLWYENNGKSLCIRDKDGWNGYFEIDEKGNFGVGLETGCNGVDLSEQQIKELMLFLDRKYGYLLEGVK